jgi:hypothetical protein
MPLPQLPRRQQRPTRTSVEVVGFASVWSLTLPTLDGGLNFHARSPSAALVSLRHENRPDTLVGRLHYSLGSTLSAHFRWSFGASERLNVAS